VHIAARRPWTLDSDLDKNVQVAVAPEPEKPRDPLAVAIGERIDAARRRAGIPTQDELVKRSGLHEKQVRRYLNGEHVPKIPALMAIASVCGVSTDWLIFGAEETPAAFFEWICGRELDERTRTLLREIPVFGRKITGDFYDRALAALRAGKSKEDVIAIAHTPRPYQPPDLP
jgi:transcriptional regulator with XRE-family HTH domain